MVLIGLGSAGIGVVQCFSDAHKKILISENMFPSTCKKEEDYENKCPKFKKELSFKEAECWFFVCGGNRCSSATLRLLETIKNKKINIVYICPDKDLCGPSVLRRHKVVYNVLQEYTRSGLFNTMCLVSNRQALRIIGDQPLNKIYSEINNTIANAIETVEWFKTQDPVMGSMHEPGTVSRICTISMGILKKVEENMLFLLDNPTETCYIYSISKTQLESNKNLISIIRDRISSDEERGIKSSFAVYESEHKQSFYYSIKFTHHIQSMEEK